MVSAERLLQLKHNIGAVFTFTRSDEEIRHRLRFLELMTNTAKWCVRWCLLTGQRRIHRLVGPDRTATYGNSICHL